MYSEILRSIEGIGLFPIVALLLFFAIFAGVVIWALKADGARMAHLAALPLEVDTSGEQCAAGPAGGRS